MLIFLDSNIICSNFKMTGPSFEVAQKVGTIVLGQIVVDEVCNKYKENLKEKAKTIKNAIQDLNKLLFTPTVFWNEIDIVDELNKYKDFLETFILENGMIAAEDYPEDKHENIVQRALQRKRPFKADGSTGYRDYLVWLTCLEIARRNSNEEVHFITNNTHDFADPNDREKMHSDLLADLADKNISESRFFYWNSLKSFIDGYAKQKFEILEAHEALVTEIEKNERGFLAPLQLFISSKVVGCSLSGYDVMVPGNYETLKAIDIDGDPQIEEVSELDDDLLLLSTRIDCIGVVTSKVYNSDIKEIEEYGLDVRVVGLNDDGSCNLETILGLQVQLRLVYSKNNKAITSIEVDDIADYNCPYCPY